MKQDQRKESLSKENIIKYLPDCFDTELIRVFEEIDSTNTEAKRLAEQGAAHGTILIANSQTAGRGRVGRSFFSPEDGGVYFSILLRPNRMEETVLMTTGASVAVADAIQSVCGVYPQIKWVNDLYYEGKKVCGILAELVTDPQKRTPEAVVVGVGINCDSKFSEELQGIAGNIPYANDMKNRLAAELAVRLLKLPTMISQREFLQKYREHSMVLRRWITLPQEPGSSYFVREIGERGELILEDKDGKTRVLSTGEISIRLKPSD